MEKEDIIFGKFIKILFIHKSTNIWKFKKMLLRKLKILQHFPPTSFELASLKIYKLK